MPWDRRPAGLAVGGAAPVPRRAAARLGGRPSDRQGVGGAAPCRPPSHRRGGRVRFEPCASTRPGRPQVGVKKGLARLAEATRRNATGGGGTAFDVPVVRPQAKAALPSRAHGIASFSIQQSYLHLPPIRKANIKHNQLITL